MNKRDNFIGKNVLLVCAETFSWPMHYIAEEIRDDCESVAAIFIQPGEVYFSGPEYKLFQSLNKDIHIYEMSSVAEKYIEQHKDAESFIDREYINKIEKEYTAYSSLNEQLLTEMTLLPYYHDRDYYEYIDYDKILLYVQIYYQYIERLFETNKPDMILDCEVDFFGRSVLLEVASKYKVPYISLDHARIDGYVLPTTSLVKEINGHIRSSYESYLLDPNLLSEKNVREMYENAKKHIGEIPGVYAKMHARQKFSVLGMLKQMIRTTIYISRHLSLKKFTLNIFSKLSSPICSDVIKTYKFFYMYYIRRFYLEFSNIFDKKDLTKINYIYVPLHVIPESSTTVLSPYYINETFIIESLSKSIRSDQYIVVKEHWSMIGYRPISYYKKIKRLPNIILIDPTSYALPKDYITNSDLVVTISGSSAFEASVLGINSLVFSDVIYGLLSSVKKVYVDENLRKTIAQHISYKMPEKEFYAYLKVLLTWGGEVRIKRLLVSPLNVDRSEVKQDIENLLDVFDKGLQLYKENRNV